MFWFKKKKKLAFEVLHGNSSAHFSKTILWFGNKCVFIYYAKAFDSVDHSKLGKFLQDENTKSPYLPQEICMEVKKQQLKPDVEQQTGFKLGKEYVKTVNCYPAYLTYMQSTSCKMPGWMKHKLEWRLQEEYQ